MVDISRGTSGVAELLPKDVSTEIWANTLASSAVMQLARPISLPGRGVTIPVITGEPTAGWVDETNEKPVSRATLSNKSITPYTLAVIEPFSNQFRRDLPALYAELVRRLPFALGKKFDATVFASSGAPGSNFAQLGGATAVALGPGSGVTKGTYSGLVKAYTTVASAFDGTAALNGWALASAGKGLLLNQVDTTGRPLLVDSIANGSAVPQILGEKVTYSQGVYASGTPNTIGYAGDWSTAVYGTVEGVQIMFLDQATLVDGTTTVTTSGSDTVDIPNLLSLPQRNMFAIRAEIEIGFQVRDTSAFVKLTDATIA